MHWKNLGIYLKRIRHIFFEGGRDIPMNNIQRESILKEGLIGLLETSNMDKSKGISTTINTVNKLQLYKTICI